MHIASQWIAYVRLQPDCAWLLALGHYLRCGPYTPRRGHTPCTPHRVSIA